jgi:hypothetical protein
VGIGNDDPRGRCSAINVGKSVGVTDHRNAVGFVDNANLRVTVRIAARNDVGNTDVRFTDVRQPDIGHADLRYHDVIRY